MYKVAYRTNDGRSLAAAAGSVQYATSNSPGCRLESGMPLATPPSAVAFRISAAAKHATLELKTSPEAACSEVT
jgi:hypothetical protein